MFLCVLKKIKRYKMSGDSRFGSLILTESREGIVCFQKLKSLCM